MSTPFSSSTLARLQASFLAIVLPRVLSHGRVYFRDIKCPHRQEDAIQEMIGLAWQWHLRLAEKGKDATCFPTALACYAARAVRSGRRLCGQERAPDGLSPLDPPRRHFAVGTLPDVETLSDHPASETLPDDTTSPPEETVCFQGDLAAWLTKLTERDCGIAEGLMVGKPTRGVADEYGVSPARLAQRRRAFCQDAIILDGRQADVSSIVEAAIRTPSRTVTSGHRAAAQEPPWDCRRWRVAPPDFFLELS